MNDDRWYTPLVFTYMRSYVYDKIDTDIMDMMTVINAVNVWLMHQELLYINHAYVLRIIVFRWLIRYTGIQ